MHGAMYWFNSRVAALALAAGLVLGAGGCSPDDGTSTDPATTGTATTGGDTAGTTGGDTAGTTGGDTGGTTGGDTGGTTGGDTGGTTGGDTGGTAGAGPEVVTDTYWTAQQMLLANELNESGEPFAEALGYNLDDLDPDAPGMPDAAAYTLGIENYEYSRYQLGTVISRSGIGLHLMWAPVTTKMAMAEGEGFDGSMTGTANGYNEDDELMKNIMMFSKLTGQMPPAHPWPQYAEFVSGDPHLPQAVDADNFSWADFATLRWDRSKMDKTLNPAAMGQTLMKQYLWAQDMLSAFHNGADEGIDADGMITPDATDSPMFDENNDVFYGGSALDGFIGMVLTAEAINKVAFLTKMLAYDGAAFGPIDLMSYDPANGIQYFPHSVAVTEAPVMEGLPPKLDSKTVTDASSHLYDQASLLWAIASFTDMMNPDDSSDSAHMAYHAAFDGSPFPQAMSQSGEPGPFDLMKGTAKALYMNIKMMHYDPDAAAYVDTAELADGAVVRGDTVGALASAYLMVALEGVAKDFEGTPIHDGAVAAIMAQANFIIANLSDGKGGYYTHVTIGGDTSGDMTLTSQAAAVRGLYVATRVTGSGDLRQAADDAYAMLISKFHVAEAGLFRTAMAGNEATYTPQNVAVLAGALREATLEGNHSAASTLYVAFHAKVATAMQLSEGAATGEHGNDSDGDGIPYIPEQPDGLPPVFASHATFQLPQ